jgi:hypothetical protein
VNRASDGAGDDDFARHGITPKKKSAKRKKANYEVAN